MITRSGQLSTRLILLQFLKFSCLSNGDKYAVAVMSIIRRENFQEVSFLVLEIPGKAIRYNLVDNSFKVIWDFAVDFGLEQIDRWAFGRLKVWQYIETFSGRS